MADETENTEEEAQEKEQAPKKKKNKKKGRGCGFYLLPIILAAGVAAGVQASGSFDLRPFVYEVVPRLPKVGKDAAAFLGIPEVYSLTAADRRRLELDAWERRLAEQSRSIDAQMSELDARSGDIVNKEEEISRDRADLAAQIQALAAASEDTSEETVAKGNELRDVINTFSQMTPKSAAAIIEKLDRPLAIEVLKGTAEDARAKILAKMNAEAAAVLTEALSQAK